MEMENRTEQEQLTNQPKQSIESQNEKTFCANCGAMIEEGQTFCPKCGKKVTETAVKKAKKNPLKVIIPIMVAAILLLGGVVGFFMLRGKSVSNVVLNKTEITIEEGKKAELVCTVEPDDAKDKTVTWRSSNNDVASVSEEGVITAKKEGTCTITVQSNNGITDSCKVIVDKHIPDFMELFGDLPKKEYFSIASDGMSMMIDTNPYDKDNDDFLRSDYNTMMEALDMVEEVNGKLGFSSALLEKMNHTNSMQGMLSQQNENYEVNWSYHPDKGLQVIYELRGK